LKGKGNEMSKIQITLDNVAEHKMLLKSLQTLNRAWEYLEPEGETNYLDYKSTNARMAEISRELINKIINADRKASGKNV